MRFQLEPAERAVTDLLRVKPQPLPALIESQIADEATVRRVVHLLALTRHLDLGARPIGVDVSGMSLTPAGVPPVSSRRPPSFSTFPVTRGSPLPSGMPPSSTPPHGVPLITTPPPSIRSTPPGSNPETDLATWRAEILARAERTAQQTHYELLGVAPHARASEIQVAFLQLAKKWHPDRLNPALADLKDTVTRTFARMNEAVQVLSDELQRRQYDAKISGGGALSADEEHVQRVLMAATAFQKAQALLRTNNLGAAEIEAKRAVEDDPSQGEYLALYTWILAQAASPDVDMIGKFMTQLSRAAQHEPNNERILFYRGLVHKRLGKEDHAYRDFKAVLEINPHNIEAAREVRFHRMRHPTRSGPPPAVKDDKSGHKPLLDKLFKR
jgi:curved DNA-binding protein CbpA